MKNYPKLSLRILGVYLIMIILISIFDSTELIKAKTYSSFFSALIMFLFFLLLDIITGMIFGFAQLVVLRFIIRSKNEKTIISLLALQIVFALYSLYSFYFTPTDNTLAGVAIMMVVGGELLALALLLAGFYAYKEIKIATGKDGKGSGF